jgi:hypothetical protein
LLSVPSAGSASTVYWSSDLNSLLFTSTGATLDGTFSFEIGTFDNSFLPTWANFDQWAANWRVIDRIFDPTPEDPDDGDPEGWNIPDQFYTGVVEFDALGQSASPDADPATYSHLQGQQVYLWVYNSKTQVPGTEWALITNTGGTGNSFTEWVIPDPLDNLNSYEWNLRDADTAIVGGVNETRGGGFFSIDPGTYNLQTAVVPEPGSLLLLVMACLPMMQRRVRKV